MKHNSEGKNKRNKGGRGDGNIIGNIAAEVFDQCVNGAREDSCYGGLDRVLLLGLSILYFFFSKNARPSVRIFFGIFRVIWGLLLHQCYVF